VCAATGKVGEARTLPGVSCAWNYLGFLYQKNATATKSAVIIQRMISFARFFSFSSAIGAVQHT